MKKTVAILMITVVILLSACVSGTGAQGNVPSNDFSGVDFTGKWCVSEIQFPGGKPLDSSEMQLMGANITLELISGGVYFVYGTDGAVLGQGLYSISGSVLTCTAGEEQTVYQIIDENTLRSVSDDRSTTVMSKQPEPSPVVSDEEPSGEDITDSDTDQQPPEDSDLPEDSSTPSEDMSDTSSIPTTESN